MSAIEEIVEQVGEAYDEAVRDLSVEEAIEVAEGVHSHITAALAGLREDLEQQS